MFGLTNLSALVARINRKLEKLNDNRLRKSRGLNAFNNLGEYYVLDVNRNLIIDTSVNVESLARELGVMHEFETVAA